MRLRVTENEISKHQIRLAVEILLVRKDKRTVAEMMKRTIFDYLEMANNVIPNPKQNY